MKRIHTSCLCLLLMTGVARGDGQALPPRTDINPALLYYQAFLLAPEPMSEADSAYLYSREAGMGKLPQRYDDMFKAYDPEFQLIRQAASCEGPCDWGIDLSEGPSTLLPQLARAKAVMVATRFRVMWQLENGRETEARDELLAAFALARKVPRNPLLISALVEISSEAINCATVAENFGRFQPDTLKALAAGMQTIPRVSVAQCVEAEKALSLNWLSREIERLRKDNPGNDAKVMEGIRLMLPEKNNWETLRQAAGGTSDGLLRLLQDAASYSEKVAEILALPFAQYDARMEQFKAQLPQPPNPFVIEGLRGLEKSKQREFRVLVYLAMVRAAVEYKLQGENGLRSVPDPCGDGPFRFQRFVFEGLDRGFELKSAYKGQGFEDTMIFVEKPGPAFGVNGVPGHVGKSRPAAKK